MNPAHNAATLAHLAELSDDATQGEWRVVEGSPEDGSIYIDADAEGLCPVAMLMAGSPHNHDRKDAAFIVAAVSYVREVLAAPAATSSESVSPKHIVEKSDNNEPAATSSDAGREAMQETVAFVQYWLMNADYGPLQFDRDFAAAIDARCAAVLARAGGEGWRTDTTWEVWEDDLMVASADSEKEARHYFAVYSQDGPVRLVKAETRRLDITPAAPDAEVL